MTTMSTGPIRTAPRADNDIYTALVVIAFCFVLAATIYVAYRAQTMFGSIFPLGGG